MKNIEYISGLIYKEITGNASREDKKNLMEWRNRSVFNEELYQEILSEQEIAASFQVYENIDKEKAYRKIIGKKTSIRKIVPVWSRYAAVLLLGLIVSVVFYYTNRDKSIENQSAINSSEELNPYLITSERVNPYLITSKGEKYDLKDSASVEIEEEGLVIENRNETLNYNQDITGEEKREISYHTLVVPRGEEYKLYLADGTAIWLNSESSLSYPEVFNGQEREVNLKGEAYFEVAHDENKPFIVVSDKQKVQVYGTSFNVKDYNDDELAQTTLVEGSVKVTAANTGKSSFIKPSEQAVLEQNNLNIRKVDVDQYVSWKDGIFICKKERLEDIMKNISRWYNVEILFSDQEARDYHFTVYFDKTKGIDYVITQFNATNKVNIKLLESTLTISAKEG